MPRTGMNPKHRNLGGAFLLQKMLAQIDSNYKMGFPRALVLIQVIYKLAVLCALVLYKLH